MVKFEMDHSFSKYAKFSKKLTFLTCAYQRARILCSYFGKFCVDSRSESGSGGFSFISIFCNSATVCLFFTHLKLLMQKVFFKKHSKLCNCFYKSSTRSMTQLSSSFLFTFSKLGLEESFFQNI